jgi:hypothetical protein
MKNEETCSIVGGAQEGSRGNSAEDSDEEIPSDSEEELPEQDVNDVISDQSEEDGKDESRKRLKRKRKRPDWVNKIFIIPPHSLPTNNFLFSEGNRFWKERL